MPLSDARDRETVSAFLSHSYGACDVNLSFFELISTVTPIAFRVDLGKFRTSTTRLERMIRDADAFFGVWPLPGDPRANWKSEGLIAESKYFRLELDMAIRARKPGVVFFDRRYRGLLQTPSELHAVPYDAQEVNLLSAAPGWHAAGRLIGGTAGRRRRDRARRRFVGRERDGGAVVRDFERVAPEQGVAGLSLVHLDPNAAPLEDKTEGQAGELSREPGCEAQ